ncbi:hypothetical protein PHYSODRAFT_322793 [Phytophthora sojae]|uniref:Uncharacterized protein n=1 Tax=Phytophthora sojae (strain P6497) TaxID=1094619 RepID=G4YMQ8_PHYSP|nr:hypothetical protein PHYSODRAFT_322793 [Phytophthora sojae]EGZ29255.1 hypothetical protein PHYSODRAFT_322793 [Phytophthora sojae]|eukprot:XP_009516530.1 hypothetical protein PHYSODRAFT_322793 [Phytophthora sojae]
MSAAGSGSAIDAIDAAVDYDGQLKAPAQVASLRKAAAKQRFCDGNPSNPGGVSTKETGSVWEGARLKIHALARDIALARPAASRSPMLFWRRLASSTPPGWGFSASAAPSARGETRRAKSRASQRRPENGNGIKPRQLPAVKWPDFCTGGRPSR